VRKTLPLLLALLAATGCGGSSSGISLGSVKSGPPPVSSTTGGWKVYAPAGGGYRVEIPNGWTTLDAASVAGSSALDQLTKANPDLQGATAGFKQIAARPGALLAIDTSSAGKDLIRSHRFAANILVRRADLNSSASDAKLLAAVVEQNRSSAAGLATLTGSPRVSRSRISGRPAAAVTYSFTVTNAAGVRNPVTEADHIVVSSGVAFIISCTTVTSDLGRLGAVCGHALTSFALTG
jgi:hypothetical protein